MRRQSTEAGSVGPLRVQQLHGEPGEVEGGKIAGRLGTRELIQAIAGDLGISVASRCIETCEQSRDRTGLVGSNPFIARPLKRRISPT